MAVWQYIGRSLRRRPVSRIILGAIGLVIVILLCVLEGVCFEQKKELAQVETMPIQVGISDKRGEKKEGLALSEQELSHIRDTTSLGACLTDEVLRWTGKLVWLEGYGERPKEGASVSRQYTLIGITSLKAAPELTEEEEIQIAYEGISGRTIFSSITPICLMGEQRIVELGKSPGDTVGAIFKTEDGWYETELVIGGVIGGSGAEIKEIYCGWEALQYLQLAAESRGTQTVDSLKQEGLYHYLTDRYSAVIKDNGSLMGFKAVAKRYYSAVDPLASVEERGLALTVYDSLYQSTTKELKKNIRFLDGLRPVLWVAAGGICFLAGFLAARSRRREIAVIRSLGAGKFRVFLILVLEQVMLALLGTAIGLGGYLLFGGKSLPKVWEIVLILILYLAGTVAPALRLMGDKKLAILMKKD